MQAAFTQTESSMGMVLAKNQLACWSAGLGRSDPHLRFEHDQPPLPACPLFDLSDSRVECPSPSPSPCRFHSIAAYYGLPSLSFRDAFGHAIQQQLWREAGFPNTCKFLQVGRSVGAHNGLLMVLHKGRR